MSEIITILSVTPGTAAGKSILKVKDTTGRELTAWPGDAFGLIKEHGEGKYEVEAAQNAKGYWRIESAKYLSPATAESAPPKANGTDWAAKEKHIIRESALSSAVALAGPGANYEQVKALFADFVTAIETGAFPKTKEKPSNAPQTPAVAPRAPPEAKIEKPPATSALTGSAPTAQLPLNGPKHDWQWFCAEVLKIKGMTVMKAMAILEIEKADQWKQSWDEALAKVKA